MAQRIKGVLSPVVTPFTRDYAPDAARFVRHCKWLLAHGCSGLAVFGTNSEANSLSVQERMDLLDALVAGGVPAAQLMPGTGCSAQPSLTACVVSATESGNAEQPVPGINCAAGTPPATSASSKSMRSCTDSEFASLLVPKTASPEQPCASSHLQWRTKRAASGA